MMLWSASTANSLGAIVVSLPQRKEVKLMLVRSCAGRLGNGGGLGGNIPDESMIQPGVYN